jgi:sensor histidine kinase regulating citrate/malate metabolism
VEQAMPNGGKITLTVLKQNGEFIITIEDTDEGIPEDVKPTLFKPLFTTKAKVKALIWPSANYSQGQWTETSHLKAKRKRLKIHRETDHMLTRRVSLPIWNKIH